LKVRLKRMSFNFVHKRFLLLLGLFMGSHVRAAAQTPAPRVVLAQEHVALISAMLPTVPTPWPSLLLSQDLEKSNAHFNLVFAGTYERDYNLEHLSPMDEVKTLSLTQSSLPLVQLWRGRLQLNFFQSTLHIQNELVDPFESSGTRGSRPTGQSYLGAPRSEHLSGLSLSFHLGRDARTGQRALPWQRLSRILGTTLN
jgi:hypothetical protein